MVEFGNTVNSLMGQIGAGFWTMLFSVVGILLGGILIVAIIWARRNKKKWNLRAEIKLLRDGGKLGGAEWGKASFNSSEGVCYVKREGRGSKPIPIPVFDIRKYVQGNNIVTFLQITPTNLKPVFTKSWEEYVKDKPLRNKSGELVRDIGGNPVYEKASVMNIEIDDGNDVAWQNAWKKTAQAFTLKSAIERFQTPISIAIVIIACFVGFSILWARLGTVCG